MTPAIAAASLYAGVNIALLLVLAILVVMQRMQHKVAFGTGGIEALERASRVHANAVEYIAAGLAGLIVLALAGAPVWVVHVGGLLLTGGRIAHAVGFSGSSGPSQGRMFGQAATFTAFAWIAGACIWASFPR